MTNTGRAKGGPFDGAELSSDSPNTVRMWTDPGSDTERRALYHFVDGEWHFQEEAMGSFPPKGKPVKRKPKGK